MSNRGRRAFSDLGDDLKSPLAASRQPDDHRPLAESAGQSFSKPRLRADAGALAFICRVADRAMAAGKKTHTAIIDRLIKAHDGRVLPNGARLRLSRNTIYRHLKTFRAGGRSKDAFVFRYITGPQYVTPALKRKFLARCNAPGVTSRAQAWRLLHMDHGDELPSPQAFDRALLPGDRAALRSIHRARLNVIAVERRFLGK